MYAVKITTACELLPQHTHTAHYWLESFAALRRIVETSRHPVVSVVCDHHDEFAKPMCDAPDMNVVMLHD